MVRTLILNRILIPNFGKGDLMTIKKVLSEIKKGDYEYVDMRFTDPRGKLQHVSVMASEADEGFLKSGWMFDGLIAGWKSINESDMKLIPDLDLGYLDLFYL